MSEILLGRICIVHTMYYHETKTKHALPWTDHSKYLCAVGIQDIHTPVGTLADTLASGTLADTPAGTRSLRKEQVESQPPGQEG